MLAKKKCYCLIKATQLQMCQRRACNETEKAGGLTIKSEYKVLSMEDHKKKAPGYIGYVSNCITCLQFYEEWLHVTKHYESLRKKVALKWTLHFRPLGIIFFKVLQFVKVPIWYISVANVCICWSGYGWYFWEPSGLQKAKLNVKERNGPLGSILLAG